MKILRFVLIGSTIGILLLTGCAKKDKGAVTNNQTVKVAGAETTTQLDKVSQIEKQVNAYNTILKLRKAIPPNIAEIEKLYISGLVPLVTEVDKNVPGYKAEIDGYFKKIETEEKKAGYFQAIDKGLQLSFVYSLMNHLDNIDKEKNDTNIAMDEYKKAKAFHAVVEVIAKRRGVSAFNDEQKFSSQMNLMYKELEKAINEKNVVMIPKITEEIRLITKKVYFLSVLFEINGIIENRGMLWDEKVSTVSGATNKQDYIDIPDILFEKKMEGIGYFNIIKAWSKDNTAKVVISNELNKEPNEINVDTIKDNLKISFPEFSEEFKTKF